ncbi:DUF881 domain-containing protein [Jatrophihabitans sp.]|uniref:DUF881 domain-containing protein n=1 Tax=Jatrophihabitans sp. TaxID=1932789 RepID=UPI002BA486E2|nr:DUF881 domain-containing protein [Jatrophihabitans sp.]
MPKQPKPPGPPAGKSEPAEPAPPPVEPTEQPPTKQPVPAELTDEPAAEQPSAEQPAAEPAGGDRPPRRRNRGATVLIGALLAMLGFALAVQFRSNSTNDVLAGAREADLVRILDDQNSRIDRLQSQISDLQAARQRLSLNGSNNAAAREEAQRQADALAVLTGAAPAHGPGIRVLISDPQRALRAEELLDVVEELRGAGAEVIQFGPVRIGTSSAFTDSGAGVSLDGTALQSPYEVLAIGDPKTLDTALNIQGGVVNTVHAAGGEINIAEQSVVSITVTRTIPAPRYATPAGK